MILIKDATISTGKGNDTRDVHIFVDGELISDIIDAASPIPEGANVIDASGLLVLPGAIDPHVHFDTPGYTEREDFEYGTKAAAAAGVTCVIDMPDTSVPPVTDLASLKSKLSVIENMAVVDFALWGGISGNSFRKGNWRARLKNMKKEGVVGFKAYLLSGMRTFEHLYPLELVEVMRFAKEIDVQIGLHAEDREMVTRQTAALQTAERFDAKAYYESRCDPAEASGIRQGVVIASETGCKLHIVHVGSADGAKDIVAARNDGADITFETCAHYLAFSKNDLIERGSIVKTAPVVKTKDDSKKLWEMIANGDVDFIASDHAPCTYEEKNTGSIWTDYAGMPGTELMFPYVLSEGYFGAKITLARLIELTSKNAAKRYGIDKYKGGIEKGKHADFVFIDTNKTKMIKGADLHSKGNLTPFEGREFKGRIMKTICRGEVAYDDENDICVKPGFGRFIKREV